MRLTEAQYKKFLSKSIDYKQSKYKNKKATCDGIEFDSQKERNYYLKFKAMQDLGLIKNLELQKEYILQDKFVLNGKTRRKITYKADFSYVTTEDDKLHVVDVKGFKTDVYKLKKKLFEFKYQVELEEV